MEKEYQGRYNPDMYPSAYLVNRIRNTGKTYPGSYSRREKRILMEILSEFGFNCEIKCRPTGSMPYIVIRYTKPDETEKDDNGILKVSVWWANDIRIIESFLNRYFPSLIGKFIDCCWARF